MGNDFDLEALKSIQVLSHYGNHWTILIPNIATLPSILKALSEQPIQSFQALPPSLEDYFMQFYAKNNSNFR